MDQVLQNLLGELLSAPLSSLAITVVAIVLALVGGFALRWINTNEVLTARRLELEILAKGLGNIFLRIAFPEVNDEGFARILAEYELRSDERVEAGLSYIDPRMLYAIDQAELLLPQGSRIDFNVILDQAEGTYQLMKATGIFDDRTDGDLPFVDLDDEV